jgi:hypothetical protein
MTTSRKPLFSALLAAALGLASVTLAAAPVDGAALKQRHEEMRARLAASPFGRPLLLASNDSSSQPQGDVYAVVRHPFKKVVDALQQPARWCELMMLQTNIKRCELSGADTGPMLRVAIARRHDQAAEDAFQVDFRHSVQSADADHLQVQIAADAGPLGTRDYRLALEAIPIDATQTFVHLSYAYSAGIAARLASDAYLATSGRHKVGFSVSGRDAEGRPVLVGGSRGVAERNTMRYYLALESTLASLNAPAGQRAEQRLRDWYAATARFPRQLHEMSREEYLEMKRRELGASAPRDRTS